MGTNIFQIDHIDKQIIDLLQKDPNITHTDISRRVNRSQPTVGERIRKMKKAGILKFQAGINLKDSQLMIGWLDIETKNPEKVFAKVEECPFVVNAFKRSGKHNVCAILAAPDLKTLDHIVTQHFRCEQVFIINEFDLLPM